MEIIISDLTRFAKEDIVCTAGIIRNSDECVRPMPYLKRSFCEKLAILPGSVIEGDFRKSSNKAPHIENYNYVGDIKNLGPCTSEEFRKILSDTVSESVEDGFSTVLPDGQKHLPLDSPPKCSI